MAKSTPEPLPVVEEDEISKALNAIGVKYSHQNTAILQPSRVEEVRTNDALRVRLANDQKALYLLIKPRSVGRQRRKKLVLPEIALIQLLRCGRLAVRA